MMPAAPLGRFKIQLRRPVLLITSPSEIFPRDSERRNWTGDAAAGVLPVRRPGGLSHAESRVRLLARTEKRDDQPLSDSICSSMRAAVASCRGLRLFWPTRVCAPAKAAGSPGSWNACVVKPFERRQFSRLILFQTLRALGIIARELHSVWMIRLMKQF